MMTREVLEQREYEILTDFATKAADSRGRRMPEEKCTVRTDFQRDRDRIIHSKSFRRLMHKTQVFLGAEGDHYRTRLTHTLEVSQIARTIVRGLGLNEDLTEAIALGHDLGHTPFGHCGELVLDQLCPTGFVHSEQSVRIVEKLEKDGKGLNLTWEVRDGILNHQTETTPATPEGKIVRLSDKIAYVNSDIDDAIRANLLSEDDIPLEIRKTLGFNVNDRLNRLIHDVIMSSMDSPDICMSDEVFEAMQDLRHYLFDNVYRNPVAKGEEVKAKRMIAQLYEYYMEHFEDLPQKYRNMVTEDGEAKERVICDYISGMTDQFACMKFNEFFVPVSWQLREY
jgi:dGTPase